MPVNWTVEKDLQLLIGALEHEKIVLGGKALHEYLANMIGGDCTPKAVSHRLVNLRTKAAQASRSTPSTPKKDLKNPDTPVKSTSKRVPTKKVPANAEDDQDGEVMDSPSTSKGGKKGGAKGKGAGANRGRKRKTVDEENGLEGGFREENEGDLEGFTPKKIKTEVIDMFNDVPDGDAGLDGEADEI